MKRGLLYYCLVLSVILHLALVVFFRLDQYNKKKESEPVVIDLAGPLKLGAKTVLPEKYREVGPARVRPSKKAPNPARNVPMPPIRPSAPSIASPAAPPPPPAAGTTPRVLAQAPAPMPAPGDVRVPEPAKVGPVGGAPGARFPATPSKPSAASPGSHGDYEAPRKSLLEAGREYLMTKVERETEKTKDDNAVTLDTDDLMYTAYMEGLKRRIEDIWKYPETARRDGLQGSLVMKFTIAKSGKVEDIELIKSSGYQMLDDAAKQALLDASPFNPLPDDWKKDRFTITGRFIYRLYGGLELGG